MFNIGMEERFKSKKLLGESINMNQYLVVMRREILLLFSKNFNNEMLCDLLLEDYINSHEIFLNYQKESNKFK
jgi:hypothetical protein